MFEFDDVIYASAISRDSASATNYIASNYLPTNEYSVNATSIENKDMGLLKY